MLSPNPVKILKIVLCLPLIFTGCSFWSTSENRPIEISKPKSDIPFSTREPDVFQTEVVVRTGDKEERMFVARSGVRRRVDYDVGTETHQAIITTDREYKVYFKGRAYSEDPMKAAADADQSGGELAHILNLRDYSEFEEIGREGGIVRYRVKINQSAASEVIVTYDEAIGQPVKQEFYSLDGETRVPKFTVELRNFKLEADDSLFAIPAGFSRAVARPFN